MFNDNQSSLKNINDNKYEEVNIFLFKKYINIIFIKIRCKIKLENYLKEKQ